MFIYISNYLRTYMVITLPNVLPDHQYTSTTSYFTTYGSINDSTGTGRHKIQLR